MSLSRRRYLLSVVNLEKYRELLMNYIYHNIIPDTISGKNVKDTGKTKLLEIFGNGEIENQLIENGNFEDASGWSAGLNSTLTVSNGVATITFDSGASSHSGLYQSASGKLKIGDVLFFRFWIKYNSSSQTRPIYYGTKRPVGSYNSMKTKTINSNTWVLIEDILTISSTNFQEPESFFIGHNANINFPVEGDSIEIKLYNVRNLTQEYGAGNEPTSLDDPRIKKIIAEGYEPENTGTYKSSVVESIETKGFNIWDEEWELGSLDTSGNYTPSIYGRLANKNLIRVLPNTQYYLKIPIGITRSCWYDKNGNFISSNYNTNIITTPTNACWFRFVLAGEYGTTYNHDICINRSGARNGAYVPHRWQDFYQQVEYIESTGEQYIDTGFIPTNNTGVNFAFSTDYDSDQIIFGTQTKMQIGSNKGSAGTNETKVYYGWNGVNTAQENRKVISLNTLHTCKLNYLNNRKSLFDDVQDDNLVLNFATLTQGSFSLYVFARDNTNNVADFLSQIKLYSFQITDGTTLVRNFIPCYRKSDSVIGLYDTVTGQFFTNQGTGTFLKGNDVLMDNQIKLPAPLQLDGAINAKNTFEVTKTAYVFTRNVWNVDMGTLVWNYNSTPKTFVTLNQTIGAKPQQINLLPSKVFTYKGTSAQALTGDNQCYSGSTNMGFRYDTANGDTTAFANAMIGNYVHYQLATPQVISIPRKRLGVVDLESLSPDYSSTYSCWRIRVIPNKASHTKNLFCSKYMFYYRQGASNPPDMNMWIRDADDYIYFQDSNLTSSMTAQQVKEYLSGIYLFYETKDEVADFVDTALFQRGGEITTYGELYDEVEYIESSGTQWIDTGVVGNTNTTIYCEGSRTENVGNASWVGGELLRFVAPVVSSGTFARFLGKSFQSSNIPVKGYGEKNTIKGNTNKYILNGVSYSYNEGSITATNDTTTIKTTGMNGGELYPSYLRLWSLKIYDNNTLIRDLVPVIRKKDQVAGLYDKVEGKFYTNKGTGAFVTGAYVRTFDSNECLPDLKMKVQIK